MLIQRMSARSIDLDLRKQRKRDMERLRHESFDFRFRFRFLIPKLIAWESEDGKPFGFVFRVQLLQLRVIRRG